MINMDYYVAEYREEDGQKHLRPVDGHPIHYKDYSYPDNGWTVVAIGSWEFCNSQLDKIKWTKK